ncbi:hypothetical protein PsB1_0415 [Candidatus Phycosocius spiralis]|uniref:Uncharacterized protein n=1 Tax=Candidatus Phycosocius spiralis TaxID=2815099 RepID=A0ABQ4PTG9_9PROT|nr:hypothetical protein PsB1_0415 [Candidatus Phycosocius spiralis]
MTMTMRFVGRCSNDTSPAPWGRMLRLQKGNAKVSVAFGNGGFGSMQFETNAI